MRSLLAVIGAAAILATACSTQGTPAQSSSASPGRASPSAVGASLPTPGTSPAPVTTAPTTWVVDMPAEAQASLGSSTVIRAVANANGRLVAVGPRECQSSGTDLTACSAHVLWSEDGVSWTTVVSGDLDVGTYVDTSGPDPGMVDVAGGPEGFVAIGYAGSERVAPAVWTSRDGEGWKRATLGKVFDGARVRAVVAGGPGWVTVGKVYTPDGPRGAAWTSPDGQAWTRAPDGPAFDVGGYLDTLEDPGSGGLLDVAAVGEVIVAVGTTCDATGKGCRAATWKSPDGGATWTRSSGLDGARDFEFVVHGDHGFVAFGRACEGDAADSACQPVVATSSDGSAWASANSTVLPAAARFRAAVAIEGGIVAVASVPSGVLVIVSRDGTTWQVLHEEHYVPTPPATAPPDFDFATIDGLAITTGPAGRALFLGHVYFPQFDDPPFSFVGLVGAPPS